MPNAKLVILDRDGVINADSDEYVKTVDEWIALPGSIDAIARLSQAGWRVVVATNQSGLARGMFDMAELNAMHAKMHRAVAAAGGRVDAVFYCPHGPDDDCDCRKPLPGMFEQIARRYDTSLDGVPVIGDSLRDLQAGAAVGCTPHLVLTGKGQRTLAKAAQGKPLPPGTRIHTDLAAAVADLLKENP